MKLTIQNTNTGFYWDSETTPEHLSFYEGFELMLANCNDVDSGVQTRDWLQSTINLAKSKGVNTLIFPKNLEFFVTCKKGSQVGYINVGSYALTIPSNMTIDLNGSTIKITPNNYMIYYGFFIEGDNITLKNGKIIGERLEHTHSGNKTDSGALKDDEFGYGVYMTDAQNPTLENLDISEFTGDGVNVNGYCPWNHNGDKPISTDKFEYGELTGSSVTAKDNCYTSPFIEIAKYLSESDLSKGRTLWPNPGNAGLGNKMTHLNVVSYYDADKIYISKSKEIVPLGTGMNIPEGAKYFRFSVETTKDIIANPGGTYWISGLRPCRNLLMLNCECHHNGRLGLTLTVNENARIINCSFHHIWGTNNRVCIDIEGTSFALRGFLIENCKFDQRGNTSNETVHGIIMALGTHLIVRNCEFYNCGVYTSNPDVLVEGCRTYKGDIILGYEETRTLTDSGTIAYHAYPLKYYGTLIVRDCRVEGDLCVLNGIVEGCVIYGGITTSNIHSDSWNVSNGIYRNCKLYNTYSLVCKRLEGCYIYNPDRMYEGDKTATGVTEIVNCELVHESKGFNGTFYPLRINNCKITITGTDNDKNVMYRITEFEGNTVSITAALVTASSFRLYPLGSATKDAVIAKNRITSNTSYGVIYFEKNSSTTLPGVVRIIDNYVYTSKALNANEGGLFRFQSTLTSGTFIFKNNSLKNNVETNTGPAFRINSANIIVESCDNKLTNLPLTHTNDTNRTKLFSTSSSVLALSEAPFNAKKGYVYFNTTSNAFKVCTADRTTETAPVWLTVAQIQS